ncbi:hypothetical protein DFJ74DRAFT_689803 [Hyaloraphidium curvatum]|nr:hypothetical protein DFJ74DRAFT_689803 [Hyaloraphidium curvatum]
MAVERVDDNAGEPDHDAPPPHASLLLQSPPRTTLVKEQRSAEMKLKLLNRMQSASPAVGASRAEAGEAFGFTEEHSPSQQALHTAKRQSVHVMKRAMSNQKLLRHTSTSSTAAGQAEDLGALRSRIQRHMRRLTLEDDAEGSSGEPATDLVAPGAIFAADPDELPADAPPSKPVRPLRLEELPGHVKRHLAKLDAARSGPEAGAEERSEPVRTRAVLPVAPPSVGRWRIA